MTALDQSTLARSRLLVADALTRDRAATQKPDPHDTAVWLLEQLQQLGWRTPPDPGVVPPLRPAQPSLDGDGYREFVAAKERLGQRSRMNVDMRAGLVTGATRD